MYRGGRRCPQLGRGCPLDKCNRTLVLIVANLAHRVGNLPTVSDLSFVIGGRLAARFLQIFTFTHVHKKLHFVCFVLLGDDKGPKAESRLKLNNFHVFGQFLLALQLTQVFVVFVFVFRVRDLDHVLVQETQKLGLLHRLLYLLEVVSGHLVHLDLAIVPGRLHSNCFKL